MKSTISLHQPSTKASFSDRVFDWLDSDNNFLSSVMEESVSNRQTLLLTNAMVSFALLALFAFIDVTAAVMLVAWFAYSLHLCKEGGIK